MEEIIWKVPPETSLMLKVPTSKIGDILRMAAAVKLYELERISSGVAAQLAGVPRSIFLSRLADYGVDTFNISEEELKKETRLA